jgi:hypothetical protein
MNRWIFLALGLLACDSALPELPPPEPLAPRPSPLEQTCERIASTTQGASWRDLGSLPIASGTLVVSDPSVLDGPFEPPLTTPVQGALTLRLLQTGEGQKTTNLCLQIRARDTASGPRRLLGHAPIDAGMLLVGDLPALRELLHPASPSLVSCVEAPAEDLARLHALFSARNETLTFALPTLLCTERPPVPEDRSRFLAALREIRAEGRYGVEPRSPAWPLLLSLGASSSAPFPEASPIAFTLDVPGPDGRYPVYVQGQGSAISLEIPLL